MDELQQVAEGDVGNVGLIDRPALTETQLKNQDGAVVVQWFNAMIGPSPAVGDTARAAIEAALPALVESLATATGATPIGDTLVAWIKEQFHNTAVSQDVGALNQLATSMPDLTRRLLFAIGART